MPTKSEKQRKLFGLALSVKKGETPRKDVGKAVLKIVDSMGEKELEKYASTVKDEGVNEATTSASSGAYETPFGVSSRGEMKMLDNLKENRKVKLTVENIEKIVKRTLIREEVYSEKPSTNTKAAYNQTGEEKGKATSTKNAKAQKVYDSSAGKATNSNTNKTGSQSKKSTGESIKKVAKNQENNLEDKVVVDVNKNKTQSEDQRIEAYQNGMEDLSYENISPEKQKKNKEYLLNKSAMDSPNAQDTGVNQQVIDDAKKRMKSKEDSKFRTAKMYGSDVEYIDGSESAQSKKLAFETMKRLKYKKPFKSDKDMLKRIPKQYKQNDSIFEMYDGENKYKIRWEGNKSNGVGVILEHVNEIEEKKAHEKMNYLVEYGKSQKEEVDSNESEIFKSMLNESKELSGDISIKDLSNQSESKVFKQMLDESKERERLLKEAKEAKRKKEKSKDLKS